MMWWEKIAFCIQLIHVRGGSKTIVGANPADAGARAARHCAVFPGAYVVSTLPFPVWIGRLGVLDCSIPREWRGALGERVVQLYLDAEE